VRPDRHLNVLDRVAGMIILRMKRRRIITNVAEIHMTKNAITIVVVDTKTIYHTKELPFLPFVGVVVAD
jgi:hypothetical protein